jgi:hypothetical protein
MELLNLASSCIHLSDRIVDFVFRSTFPELRQDGIRCGFALISKLLITHLYHLELSVVLACAEPINERDFLGKFFLILTLSA